MDSRMTNESSHGCHSQVCKKLLLSGLSFPLTTGEVIQLRLRQMLSIQDRPTIEDNKTNFNSNWKELKKNLYNLEVYL
ncbi:hypothetical protein TNCT_23961 [Trichonephila clavata]|uniref:Uncharacterized protein n=1 Tax=Trichonephila clavata TaxID=2740835 RepID=A0A8X6M1S1_TRICU|nr:hypothetical protein TNCT_23961 [Trichonephila clavata]